MNSDYSIYGRVISVIISRPRWYVERTKNIEVATLHPAEVSDSEDESLTVFLQ